MVLGMKKCPSCGVDNPLSRVTCQSCKDPLSKKVGVGKDDNIDIPPKGPDPFTENVSPTKKSPPEKPAKKNTKTAKIPLPEEKMESGPISPSRSQITKGEIEIKTDPTPTKKRPRRKKIAKIPNDPKFFVLGEDGNLRAVTVRLVVSKPIKGKLLADSERVVLTLHNRNKDLLSK